MTQRNLLIHILLTAALLSFPSICFCSGETPTTFGSKVLQQDTTWSGEIIIEGVVVIGRTASLTIEPGTTILFRRVDLNNDGIGDSEIRVLGRIIAEGTPTSPISFRSAEIHPSQKDWSYLLLFTSSKKNSLKYCTFSHAFTGLQVHFSTALIQDCTFENNQEGLRFGRAKIIIEHNLIRNNNIGIRFTRMEGPAEIRKNIVTKNETGIFLVPSGQNTMDFFEPGRTGKAWNEGHLEINTNNIYENKQYNLKLGAKQMWNLKVTNNWWGFSDHASILPTIFDNHRDDELGQARIEPILSTIDLSAGPRKATKQ